MTWIQPATGRCGRLPPGTERNAGSYLRERFGADYVSLGLTFHLGPAPVPPPDYAEAVLGSAGHDAYLLDLRSGVPPAGVWRWLTAPARTRLVGPGYDPADDRAHQLSGGSLAQWFDAIVHWRKVTPARPLRVPHSEPTP
ncbi:erythromycin esterase family protein [Streptomyces sp. NPDC059076]|uniref:erythromycin esterase family protein n=1 Tax=unclassified Streptomyces TaxID=2593676 RepID=UPI0036B3C543